MRVEGSGVALARKRYIELNEGGVMERRSLHIQHSIRVHPSTRLERRRRASTPTWIERRPRI
jgi:hypothetical protein